MENIGENQAREHQAPRLPWMIIIIAASVIMVIAYLLTRPVSITVIGVVK